MRAEINAGELLRETEKNKGSEEGSQFPCEPSFYDAPN